MPIAAAPGNGSGQLPPGADAEMVSLYEAHKKIYPRSVSGFFSSWRWALVFLTQLV
ncbi:MAG: cytochrome c oxidase accessory protein CcoG, partial [Pseudomonadota bacterium]|nr:cytochrome c oxidase accessory protein CcoG [Pseudomonadota bacterium]